MTTFAIVAGVAGADLATTVVLVLGFANLMADGFAMAASNYIGTQAERDDYDRVLGIERKHIALVPDGEREEIRQIFAGKGFAGSDLERIVTVITSDRGLWAKTMAAEEYGLSPARQGRRSSLPSAPLPPFILCGLVPLVTYPFRPADLPGASQAAGATFFGVGAIKSRWSPAAWWRSGFETFVIGMSAAAVAFAVGSGLKALLQLPVV